MPFRQVSYYRMVTESELQLRDGGRSAGSEAGPPGKLRTGPISVRQASCEPIAITRATVVPLAVTKE